MDFISTSKAPQAIGPYSQAVVCHGFLYTSGQIALDPVSMEMVSDDIEDQIKQVLQNLAAVLKEAGVSKKQVVKVNIFLANMDDFNKVNAIYADFFEGHKPARSTVEVAALPKNAQIEIDFVVKL